MHLLRATPRLIRQLSTPGVGFGWRPHFLLRRESGRSHNPVAEPNDFDARENDHDASIAKVLTIDEAKRMASNFAKLPTLLARSD